MEVENLIKKLYFGDSGCKNIIIDCWAETIKIQLDAFFLLAGDYFCYQNDQEIIDGFIVFSGVKLFSFSNDNMPNDSLNEIVLLETGNSVEGQHKFAISINHIDANAQSTEVIFTIVADAISIETPSN